MNIPFTPEGWDDYLWFQQNDKAGLKRINLLIKAIQRDPFDGVGKPEPLKHNLSGFWSRRITAEHRLVYGIEDNEVQILMCRYHY
ncbi:MULTISPECIES: Txe/YoeB family addiction module toxin [Pseudomonas fluorescens group]|uniref:Txe/YoeB family addiction module toxin n=2 Tax=Pseudomonas fluorescens TaxID=294 RepID=A0ACD4XQQ7_PSEFL|nr:MULTISPECIES: Txe/YoeB family addiction module toxin [Pseudomonas fluorescens group]MBZ6458636.1 Txe/YoeB family addiction module toxin [Pseudomonas fluorescens group sp.]MBZ6463368.1 Txe/YoeB family addiction module toxin [Pseudomonas fluorescens group sp.]MBZ6469794.1 Txe/YoeB family addiction module toxin [Pseudomonas fluorescens group sp.]WQD71407.1 Txe/YoeB family addiction module toxin [Pseudomonas marginalis]CAI2799279.1 Putative mRNA interferase YoeB (Toxin YoeB) [Pseudomonas fluore